MHPQHTRRMEDGQSRACGKSLPLADRTPGPFRIDFFFAVTAASHTAFSPGRGTAVGGADGLHDGHSPTRHVKLEGRPDSEDSGSDDDHVVASAGGGRK